MSGTGPPPPSDPYGGTPDPYGGIPDPQGGAPGPPPGAPGPYGGAPNPYGGAPNPYGGPPGPYGWGSPYGAPYPVADHPQGTTVLVLGILGLVVCGLLGPVAWYMGSNALKEVDAPPGYYRNRGNIQAGRIMGMISTGIIALWAAIAVVFVIAAAAGSA